MLTKKQLMDIGLTEEQAGQIVELEKNDIDGNYEPKARNQQLRDQVEQLKNDVQSRDKQIEQLGKSAAASEELKRQVNELQEANKKQDAESAKRIAELQKEYAVRAVLSGKVHDVDVAIGLLDMDKITLDEKGSVKAGFAEQFATLEKEKSYLVIKSTQVPQKNPTPGVKPFGNGVTDPGDGSTHKDEPSGVSYAKEAAKRKMEAMKSSTKAADSYFGKQ